MVEIPFKGRIMTYPAFHYACPDMSMALNTLSAQLKSSGFKYVVVMSADGALEQNQITSADLVLSRSVLIQEVGEEGISRLVGEKSVSYGKDDLPVANVTIYQHFFNNAYK